MVSGGNEPLFFMASAPWQEPKCPETGIGFYNPTAKALAVCLQHKMGKPQQLHEIVGFKGDFFGVGESGARVKNCGCRPQDAPGSGWSS